MPVQSTLEAKVKDAYHMGPVIAFSGHEYVQSEWRPVPIGFEPAALAHPFLDVRDAESHEIRVTAKDQLADTLGTADIKAASTPREVLGEKAVTTATEPVEEKEEDPKTAKRRSRKSKASDEEE